MRMKTILLFLIIMFIIMIMTIIMMIMTIIIIILTNDLYEHDENTLGTHHRPKLPQADGAAAECSCSYHHQLC